MLINLGPQPDGIAVMQLNGRALRSDMLGPLRDMCSRTEAQGKSGVIIDLSRAGRITSSGLAVLVELLALYPRLTLGYCGMPRGALRQLERLGLERAMPLYPEIDDALAAPEFLRCRQSGVQIILRCDGGGRGNLFPAEISPWGLDVVGKPLVQHSLDHLARAGVRNVTLLQTDQADRLGFVARNVAAELPQVALTLVQAPDSGGEGFGVTQIFDMMQKIRNLSTREVVICPANVLVDFDLSPILEGHRNSGASLTRVPLLGRQDASLYVFNQADIDDLAHTPHIAETHLGAVQRRAPCLVDNWQGYFQLVERVLCSADPAFIPVGRQIRENVWVHPDAEVASRATIGRACYVGAGARVHKGAAISGVSAIGSGAVLQNRSLARNSLILSGTELGNGALADSVIACGDWAVSHRSTAERAGRRIALDCVKWADAPAPARMGRLA